MLVSRFDGGLSTRLDPSLIKPEESVILINCDTDKGILQSSKDILDQNTEVRGYFYKFKNKWVSSYQERSYVEYNNVLYFSERHSYPKKLIFDENGFEVIHRLGIEKPTTALTTVQTAGNISSSASVMQYVYTYYNSKDGTESAPSPVSAELNLAPTHGVAISDIAASTDPQVDKIRIYRIGDNVTVFSLVATIDNGVTSVVDNLASTLVGPLLESNEYYPAKEQLRYMVEAYGILFAALDTKLYFSEIGVMNAWPESNFIQFKKEITGILPTYEGIIIFMNDSCSMLVGTNVSEFAIKDLSTEQGCTGHFTTRYVQNVPIWQSLEGLCMFSSGAVRVVSKDKLGTKNFDIINSVAIDETYFGLLADGTLLAFDTKFDGARFKYFHFSKPLNNIYETDGVLYGVVDTDRLVSLLDGADGELHYKSPLFTEGSHSNVKTYNNVYVRSNGTFTIKIYIDEELVTTYELLGNTTHDIPVPQKKQKGFNLQVEFIGTGKIYEYEYKVMERQNGR